MNIKGRMWVPLFIAGLICSCGAEQHRASGDADIQAAMADGREAARSIVSRQWRDTVELQRFILEAKAKQSRYIMDNRPECVAAFDSGFVSGVRAVNPSLARDIFTVPAADDNR